MAHFIGDLEGRAKRSTLGSKNSGITAEVASWTLGCCVEMKHENGMDVVRVYKTAGSGEDENRELLLEFSEHG